MEAEWLHWFTVIMSTSRGVMNVNLSIDPQNSLAVLGRSEREKLKNEARIGISDLLQCVLGFVIAWGESNSVIVYILVTPPLKPIKTRSVHVG